jgi:hypothetical protein
VESTYKSANATSFAECLANSGVESEDIRSRFDIWPSRNKVYMVIREVLVPSYRELS